VQFRCDNCGARQWRGLFPDSERYLRWAVIHGVALGVCGSATKLLFARFGHTTDGWRNGLASLGVCAVLMLAFYAVALVGEHLVVVWLRCRVCRERALRPLFDDKGEVGQATDDIVVGGLYAVRDQDGTYRIVKVLVVEELAVHLRSYANRFTKLPARVRSSDLSLGGIGRPEGLGIGHFPLAREAFQHEERILVGREPVADEELDGYRIWAGIEPLDD
jgi:hypothetical protein